MGVRCVIKNCLYLFEGRQTCEDVGNGLFLNGGGTFPAQRGGGLCQLGANAEGFKCLGTGFVFSVGELI